MSFAHMTSERFWLSESSLAMITLHWKVNKILLGVDLNLSRLLGGRVSIGVKSILSEELAVAIFLIFLVGEQVVKSSQSSIL